MKTKSVEGKQSKAQQKITKKIKMAKSVTSNMQRQEKEKEEEKETKLIQE